MTEIEREEMYRELMQVRAWMRCLSAELKGMRAELNVQEKRMEQLIIYKESLEKEMTAVIVVPEGKSGRRQESRRKTPRTLEDMSQEEAQELMRLLLERYPEEK